MESTGRSLLDDCVHCGFCLAACPTYQSWGEEMDSPRGRIDLMRGLRDGSLALDADVVRHFDRCLGCMGCVPACPSGVKYDVLIEETRAHIEERYDRGGFDALTRWLLFTLLPYPRRLWALAAVSFLYTRSGLSALARRSGLMRLLPRRLLFAGDEEWAARAAAFSARVRDVTEFLASVPRVAARHPIARRVAYHDACHLAHAQRVKDAPRALLAEIPGLTLLEIPDGDQCCGSAGIYNLVQPESADEIGRRKAGNVVSTKADLLASANPGCALQLRKLLAERGVALPMAHPVEILAASIAGTAL